jgi:hypothetical protein
VKANAFVEPSNPSAIFPQIAKPNIMDFRSHKMAKGGWTGVNNFRKIYSENSKKSKYASIVKTKEELELEEQDKLHNVDMQDDSDESEEEQEVQVAKSAKLDKKKNYSIDDIMELDSKLTIGKKKKASAPVVQASSNP